MTDFIEREAAIEAVENVYHAFTVADEVPRAGMGTVKYRENVVFVSDAEKALENLPAADVRPVVKGKWIRLDMHRGMEQYKCSACNSEVYVPECMGEPMFGFCPICGADMREEIS